MEPGFEPDPVDSKAQALSITLCQVLWEVVTVPCRAERTQSPVVPIQAMPLLLLTGSVAA